MSKSNETLVFKIEKMIPAPVDEVFHAWLDSKTPGTIWNAAEKFILNAQVDGLFYWSLKGTSHFGRFVEFERSSRIKHTWMSPNTLGQESTVTVTFKKHSEGTLMTLVHSDLPNCEPAKGHEKGWNYFMGIFIEQFGNGSRPKFSWDDAHSCAKK